MVRFPPGSSAARVWEEKRGPVCVIHAGVCSAGGEGADKIRLHEQGGEESSEDLMGTPERPESTPGWGGAGVSFLEDGRVPGTQDGVAGSECWKDHWK